MKDWNEMNDLERLESLIGEEFNEGDVSCCFIDYEGEVIIDNTSVTSNLDECLCTCWDCYYDTTDSEIYHIWVDENNIIIAIH